MRLISILVLLAGTAHGQALDPVLEEERRRALEERTNTLGNFEQSGGAPDPGPAQQRSGPCFQIDTLTVEGVTLLSPGELAAIIAKYVPNCMQGADIQAIMRELDGIYAERGHITSKTYIPPQNLTDGSLTLSMLEGVVENVLLVDGTAQVETPRGERQLTTAFPNAEGTLFQLRDFEQGLDQMNRLQSVEATLRLLPGEEPGGSYALIQRVQTDPVRAYARIDNQGSESTGTNRLSFDLEWDDLLGINDAWTLGYAGSQNTNALSISASAPYGYWTFSSNLSYSEYLTPLSPIAELFGSSRSARIAADYVYSRDQTTTTKLRFNIQNRRGTRAINSVELTPQPLTTISAGIQHLALTPTARNSFDADLVVGTKWFGAIEDGSANAAITPQAQFVKLTGGWQRQAGVAELGTWVSDVRVQLTRDVLFGSEQVALGSGATVRGYQDIEAVGDLGIYWRNDLYVGQNPWTFLPDNIANKVQTYAFADIGIARDLAQNETQKAAGYGFGLSYNTKYVTISAVFGQPLIIDDKFDPGIPSLEFRLDGKLF